MIYLDSVVASEDAVVTERLGCSDLVDVAVSCVRGSPGRDDSGSVPACVGVGDYGEAPA